MSFQGPGTGLTGTAASLNIGGSAGSLSTTYTAGRILYGAGSGVPTTVSTFFYDSANGRVGIGTTSPGDMLDIQGGNLRIMGPGGNDGRLDFKRTSDGWNPVRITQQYNTGAYGGDLAFQLHPADNTLATAPVTVMYLKAGGNVGIGNSTPPINLWVPGTSTTTGIGVYNADVAMILGNLASGINGGSIQVRAGGTSSTIGTTNYILALNPDGGSVGVGTNNPNAYKFHVNGGAIGVTGTSNYLYYAVTNSTNSGAYMMFDAQTAGGSGRKYQIGTTGTGNNPGTGCFELYDATGGATRIVVNASGNVGIGTTNPGALLQVQGTTTITGLTTINNSGGNGGTLNLVRGGIFFAGSSDWNHVIYNNGGNFDGQGGFDGLRFVGVAGFQFYINNSGLPSTIVGGNMAMYINSAKQVGIATTTATGALNINGDAGGSVNGAVQILSNSGNSGKNVDAMACRASIDGNNIINFVNVAGGYRASINGVNSTSVAYATSSDRRMKTNIEDMPSAIERIKKLRPRKFIWTESGDKEEGFIAQEVHKVFPQFMSGFVGYCDYCQCSYNDLFDGKLCDCCDFENPMRKDGTPYIYGLDYGKFTPYLTKALQETLEIIETQSVRITTLETENTQIKSRLDSLESRLAAAGI